MILLANALLLFFLLLAFGREYARNIQVNQEIAALERQKASLESQNLETLDLIEELSSEYYLEKQAREKHGLARAGETLILVKDDLFSPRDGDEGAEVLIENVSNPEAWFYFFFMHDRFEELRIYAESE